MHERGDTAKTAATQNTMTDPRDTQAVRETAYHEAGHAVTALRLGIPFRRVSIVPTPDEWGSVQVWVRFQEVPRDAGVREGMERHITIWLAAAAVEELVIGQWNEDSITDDSPKAVKWSVYVACSNVREVLGLPYKRARDILRRHRAVVESEAEDVRSRSYKRAQEIVTSHRDAIERLFRAREDGPSNSVLYLWLLDPVPPGADYAVRGILDELAPDEMEGVYQMFSDSFAHQQSILNLDEIVSEPLP